MSKKFIEIVAEYPAICPYPKYEGKPYFLIRYEENGKIIEGFGTYNLEMLSGYIRAYFIGAKKGKWIYRTEITCSVCGSPTTFDDNFCSHCGADMRGEEERR